ncbi:Laccase-4, partial [Cucurbita argyrosperma subsp. sororia]
MMRYILITLLVAFLAGAAVVESLVRHYSEWWKGDVEDMVNKSIVSGLPPAVSDVHTINGHPGPVHGCATNGTQMDKHTKIIKRS